MRTDVLDLHAFYQSPLGAAAQGFIASRLSEVWGDGARLRIAGFGYAVPYLAAFAAAERVISLAPGGQGVMRWPSQNGDAKARNQACLVEEHRWPLPDASIDRVLIVHGLEETGEPRRLMREIWRVRLDFMVTSGRCYGTGLSPNMRWATAESAQAVRNPKCYQPHSHRHTEWSRQAVAGLRPGRSGCRRMLGTSSNTRRHVRKRFAALASRGCASTRAAAQPVVAADPLTRRSFLFLRWRAAEHGVRRHSENSCWPLAAILRWRVPARRAAASCPL